ncbi:hypothetical protein [Actinoplanes sp. NPDC049265]|uniref:hypothetical protein n=1 Tax=Actinoplanes sp. NPDC049265 TaxID=3363902 RepID=UPI00370FD61F
MPSLPGDWLVFDKHLIMRPIGPIARGIDASYRHLTPILHPLYMPLDYVDTDLMLVAGHIAPGYFPHFKTMEDGAVYMNQLVEVATSDLIPYLEKNGSVEGYLALCLRQNESHPYGGDPHVLYRQAATCVVLGRYAEATETLDAMLRIAAVHTDLDPDPTQWFLDLVAQARGLHERIAADPAGTRQTLLTGTEEQRRRQRLPVTDD